MTSYQPFRKVKTVTGGLIRCQQRARYYYSSEIIVFHLWIRLQFPGSSHFSLYPNFTLRNRAILSGKRGGFPQMTTLLVSSGEISSSSSSSSFSFLSSSSGKTRFLSLDALGRGLVIFYTRKKIPRSSFADIP